jgi:hypothetical protein
MLLHVKKNLAVAFILTFPYIDNILPNSIYKFPSYADWIYLNGFDISDRSISCRIICHWVWQLALRPYVNLSCSDRLVYGACEFPMQYFVYEVMCCVMGQSHYNVLDTFPNMWKKQDVGTRREILFCACTKFGDIFSLRQLMATFTSVLITWFKLIPNLHNARQRIV